MHDTSAITYHMNEIQIDTVSIRQLLCIADVMAYIPDKRHAGDTTDYVKQSRYFFLVRQILKWMILLANFRPEGTGLCERTAGANIMFGK